MARRRSGNKPLSKLMMSWFTDASKHHCALTWLLYFQGQTLHHYNSPALNLADEKHQLAQRPDFQRALTVHRMDSNRDFYTLHKYTTFFLISRHIQKNNLLKSGPHFQDLVFFKTNCIQFRRKFSCPNGSFTCNVTLGNGICHRAMEYVTPCYSLWRWNYLVNYVLWSCCLPILRWYGIEPLDIFFAGTTLSWT